MERSIELLPETQILLGRKTKIFERFKLKTASEVNREKVCFSIETPKANRTLDLEGQNENEVEIFINQLQTVLKMIRDKAEQQANDKKQV